MKKHDKLYMSLFNDYYGAMLTKHQGELIKKYYDEDMSLREIANELGISPQGVRDSLKRAEESLTKMEEKLGLVAKTNKMRSLLQEFFDIASDEQKKEITIALDMLYK